MNGIVVKYNFKEFKLKKRYGNTILLDCFRVFKLLGLPKLSEYTERSVE